MRRSIGARLVISKPQIELRDHELRHAWMKIAFFSCMKRAGLCVV
jgi:hypothetical protein